MGNHKILQYDNLAALTFVLWFFQSAVGSALSSPSTKGLHSHLFGYRPCHHLPASVPGEPAVLLLPFKRWFWWAGLKSRVHFCAILTSLKTSAGQRMERGCIYTTSKNCLLLALVIWHHDLPWISPLGRGCKTEDTYRAKRLQKTDFRHWRKIKPLGREVLSLNRIKWKCVKL